MGRAAQERFHAVASIQENDHTVVGFKELSDGS